MLGMSAAQKEPVTILDEDSEYTSEVEDVLKETDTPLSVEGIVDVLENEDYVALDPEMSRRDLRGKVANALSNVEERSEDEYVLERYLDPGAVGGQRYNISLEPL